MPSDIRSAGECLKAIGILADELRNAKRSLINSEGCIVNRNLMQTQLDLLEQNLPDTVKKAAAIVEEEETIRSETEQKRKEILENASNQAQSMVNEAAKNAQQMVDQAHRDAGTLMDQANRKRRREWSRLPPRRHACWMTLKTKRGSLLRKKALSGVRGLNVTN